MIRSFYATVIYKKRGSRFYLATKTEPFNDASLLNSGEARDYMNLYTKLIIASVPADQRKQLTQSEKPELMINTISNDTLKPYFFKDQLSEITINNLTEFRSTFEPYKKFTKPACQASIVNEPAIGSISIFIY